MTTQDSRNRGPRKWLDHILPSQPWRFSIIARLVQGGAIGPGMSMTEATGRDIFDPLIGSGWSPTKAKIDDWLDPPQERQHAVLFG
jgi:hypothetical protein